MHVADNYRLLLRRKGYADALKINVSGAGAQTIVLGNGFGTDQGSWRHLLPWLEARARVVRFDWIVDPDHFNAARYAKLDNYAEDLLAVIALTEAAPCVLIGHSMSGMIGMIAARREPLSFRHIAMIAPAPCYISDANFVAGFDAASVDALLQSMGEDYLAWSMHFAPIVVGDADCAAVDDFRRSLGSMRPDVALAMAETIFHMDMRERLDGFDTPTTIIQPRHDPAVPVEIAHYLARRWRRARVEMLEVVGHLPQLTAPRELIEVLAHALPWRGADASLP